MEWIGRGALFHDLGKAKTHAIEHGKIGAEMGAALGLPAKDYTPRSSGRTPAMARTRRRGRAISPTTPRFRA